MKREETVLLIGSKGQLGRELCRLADATLSLVAVDIDELDITKKEETIHFIKSVNANVIINVAAYTAVDKAEEEPEMAFLCNEKAPGTIAQASLETNARLIHISTDFVFNGRASSPYKPSDEAHPLGIYGKSKLAGEQQILKTSGISSIIIRTAWLYSAHGNNFVKTMLRLMKERDSIGVVADQIGTPTYAKGLAEVIWQLVERKDLSGIYHWTDAGVASWYDFAVAIQAVALELGLLDSAKPILPLTTADYLTAAARPAYSVLDKTEIWRALQITGVHWQKALQRMMKELSPF